MRSGVLLVLASMCCILGWRAYFDIASLRRQLASAEARAAACSPVALSECARGWDSALALADRCVGDLDVCRVFYKKEVEECRHRQ